MAHYKQAVAVGVRRVNEASLQVGFAVLAASALGSLALAAILWPLAMLLLAVAVWTGFGFRLLSVASLSAPIVLGRRRAGEVLGEGWCWLPPGLAEARSLDNRVRFLEIPLTQGFSADRVRLHVKASLQFRTLDPAKTLDLGQADEAAITATSTEAISKFITYTSARRAIGRQGSSVPLAAQTLARWGRQYGIGALRLQLLDVAPADTAFISAMQRAAQQQFEIPADQRRLAAVQRFVRQTKQSGLSAQQATDLVQTERGVVSRSAQSYRWDGMPMIAFNRSSPSRKRQHQHTRQNKRNGKSKPPTRKPKSGV
jgi:hypothetical protein